MLAPGEVIRRQPRSSERAVVGEPRCIVSGGTSRHHQRDQVLFPRMGDPRGRRLRPLRGRAHDRQDRAASPAAAIRRMLRSSRQPLGSPKERSAIAQRRQRASHRQVLRGIEAAYERELDCRHVGVRVGHLSGTKVPWSKPRVESEALLNPACSRRADTSAARCGSPGAGQQGHGPPPC